MKFISIHALILLAMLTGIISCARYDAQSGFWALLLLNNVTSQKKIYFNNAAQSTALTDFPALLKLDSTRISYNDAGINGSNLAFYDADYSTLLHHEIESWDSKQSNVE